MIGGGRTMVIWGGYLLVLWGVIWVFGSPDAETTWLLSGASAAAIVCGAITWLRGRRGVAPHGDTDARLDPDLSPATTWTAIGVVLLLTSAAFGPWLAFTAGGVIVMGVGGLVREHRAARREVSG